MNNAVITIYLQACKDSGTADRYGISKRTEAVKSCRNLTKAHMVLNDYLPKITGKLCSQYRSKELSMPYDKLWSVVAQW